MAVSQATTMVKMAKVAKASFNKNCLSNVVSSHLKRGSFKTANRAVEEKLRAQPLDYMLGNSSKPQS